MFSQNKEEQIIIDYFQDFKGYLLDIGANDGKTLSNSLALIEKGWGGLLVEPAERPYQKLIKLHEAKENIQCLNIAIGDLDCDIDFYSMGNHLSPDDTDLLSTAVLSETERWKGTEFVKTKVVQKTFASMLELARIKIFHFINIDAEGLDTRILTQMNLDELGCMLCCVEWNGNNYETFDNYFRSYEMKLIHTNAENLIYGR